MAYLLATGAGILMKLLEDIQIEPGNRRRLEAGNSLKEEIALISEGVQSLRHFVEHLLSEGGTSSTKSHLKVLKIYYIISFIL